MARIIAEIKELREPRPGNVIVTIEVPEAYLDWVDVREEGVRLGAIRFTDGTPGEVQFVHVTDEEQFATNGFRKLADIHPEET